MNHEIKVNIDEIIHALLEVRTAKPGKLIKLQESDILGLVRAAKALFL
jgi:hypothetical protein